MKKFSEIIKELEAATAEEVSVDGFIFESEENLEGTYEGLVVEKKDVFPNIPGTNYYYRIDIPYGEQRKGNLKHIHIYAKNRKQLFAMNVDGTSHDGSNKVQIPKVLYPFLTKKEFTIPDRGLIEWYQPTSNARMLLFD